MLNAQIFGIKSSQGTRAAERFFKERRIPLHIVDLKVKPMALGEIKRFMEPFGGLSGLLNQEGKSYIDAGLAYLRVSETDLLTRIEKDPALLRLPLVRCGNRFSAGRDEEAWKTMAAEASR